MSRADRTVLLFMAFLASAPVLVFYSRYARPYSMVTLLSFVSLVSCYLWWTKGKQKHGYVYVVSGALAGYFHIIAFPFVLAPILYILAYGLLKTDRAQTKLSWRKIVGPLTTLAIVLAILFGWQVKGILLASENRVGQADFTFYNVFSGFEALITGSHNHIIFGVFIILAFITIYLSRQQEKIRPFFGFLIFPVIFQFLFVLVTKPVAGDAPHIFARYLIMTLPVFLLMVAYALDELIRTLENKQLQTVILSLTMVVITLNFPWIKFIEAPANSRNTVLLAQMIYGKNFEEKVFENYLPRTRPFYREYVKTFENDISIVETPFNISFYAMPVAQFLHRKNVLAGYWDSDTMNDFSVYSSVNVKAIRELKQPINITDPNAFDDRKDYLIIFHKRLNSENTVQRKRYADEVEALLSTVKSIFGDPVYEDAFVSVFLQSNDE